MPWSAISFRSLAPIKRPSGIFPGANVFQVPPPAVDASAVSGGILAAGPGEVFTGAASGTPCAGDAAATAGRCGVTALATCIDRKSVVSGNSVELGGGWVRERER